MSEKYHLNGYLKNNIEVPEKVIVEFVVEEVSYCRRCQKYIHETNTEFVSCFSLIVPTNFQGFKANIFDDLRTKIGKSRLKNHTKVLEDCRHFLKIEKQVDDLMK